MKITEQIKSFFASDVEEIEVLDKPEIQSSYTYDSIHTVSFNGEKNPGEMGTIKKYAINYNSLSNRSWQTFLDSDMGKSVQSKFVKWVIGTGLKVQSQPILSILESSGIQLDKTTFQKPVETRFRLFANSKLSTYDQQMTLNQQSFEVYKNAIVGGDCLVILRLEDGLLSSQMVDGNHVQSPILSNEEFKKAKERGNRIVNGIELDKRNRHIAYYVKTAFNKFERVAAKNDEGVLVAFLVYGSRYRIDDHRGIPIISSGLESIKKLDRYKEAAIGGAEERAKIAYAIEHGKDSTGANPMLNKARSSVGLNSAIEGAQSADGPGQKAADLIAATTGKQAVNLPPDSSLKGISSDMELSFKEFFMTNFTLFCAAIDIPVEVALSKYDSNFSASRAALKEWEHTILFHRENFAIQYLQNIFNFWMLIEDKKQNIKAPKLFISYKKDPILFDAYTNARWVGANIPHIDPLKEVNAERAKLGPLGKNVPLTTAEQATEALNGGDLDANIEALKEQQEMMKGLIPVIEEPGFDENKEND